MRDELRALAAQIQDTREPQALFSLHREAVYIALDVSDPAAALTHALASLDLARTCQNVPLEIKAHVAMGIVQAEVYDDLGAAEHFGRAETLAREVGDDRGVALVTVNAAHYQIERAAHAQAALRLCELLESPHAAGLDLPESTELRQAFHINLLVSGAEALKTNDPLAGAIPGLRAHLAHSARVLQALSDSRTGLANTFRAPDVLDALARYALWQDDLRGAQRYADDRVELARSIGSDVMYGQALLSRSTVRARAGQWAGVIQDAQAAIRQFEAVNQELWIIRGREALADAYAHTRQFQQAFEIQREVTRHVEALYRQYHQQRALLGQITQQARDAEVRAEVYADAALHDALTGIPNRAHAMQMLDRLHQQAQHGSHHALALLDLDHFKSVNDTFGHATGDAVLTRVAQRLRAEIRADDGVARFGGEEFVVILTGVTLEAAAEACERLRAVIAALDWHDVAQGLRTSASFGVARIDGQRDLNATLSAADLALYRAKHAGRNNVQREGLLQGHA
jgi:diguanylate cyclase (GGDEF)-like protein